MTPLKRKLAEAGWADLDEVIDLTSNAPSSSSAKVGVNPKLALETAGWGDLEEVIDLTANSTAEETTSVNPKRKLKRSRRQVALKSKGSAQNAKSFGGSISVQSFSEAFLQWRVERELADKAAMSAVPEVSAKGKSSVLKKVPSAFKSTQEYSQTFLPLVLEECKAQVLSDFSPQKLSLKWGCRVEVKAEKRQEDSTERILQVFKVAKPQEQGKSWVTGTVQTEITLVFHSGRKSSPGAVQAEKRLFMADKNDYLRKLQRKTQRRDGTNASGLHLMLDSRHSKGDVLLLAQHKAQLEFNSQTGQLVRHAQYSCALAIKCGPPMFMSRDRRLDPTGCSYEIVCRVEAVLPKAAFCCQKQIWSGYCCTIANVVTSWREYSAVAAFLLKNGNMAIRQTVLSGKTPKPSSGIAKSAERRLVSSKYQGFLKEKFNESQQKAIDSIARKTSNVALIQGPPGTGKTTTLVGLLNTVHLVQHEEYYDLQFKRVLGLRKALEAQLPQGEHPIVLVCAPSNTAIDGIVKRIMHRGFRDKKLSQYFPKIVRCGVQSSDALVQQVELEALVQKAILSSGQAREVAGHVKRLKGKLDKAVKHLRSLDESSASLLKCAQDVVGISEQLWSAQRKERLLTYASSKKIPNSQKQRKIRCCVLENAQIILATLSSSAIGELEHLRGRISRVIVDEAGQAVEPSTLIPLSRKNEQLVLIGDPAQLPPTVISQVAVDCNYSQSLFERLQHAGHPTHLLDTQYRCHPSISGFVSKQFYGGKLRNGPNVLKEYNIPCHKIASLGPLVFFHVGGRESRSNTSRSFVNEAEARFVTRIYHEIRKTQGCSTIGIGIITPYSAQLQLLRTSLRGPYRNDSQLELNTVDGYQGREFDVIILSLVRSSNTDSTKASLGFLRSERRLNVALSRARYSLLVVGDKKLLSSSRLWSNFLKHVHYHGTQVDARGGSEREFTFR